MLRVILFLAACLKVIIRTLILGLPILAFTIIVLATTPIFWAFLRDGEVMDLWKSVSSGWGCMLRGPDYTSDYWTSDDGWCG